MAVPANILAIIERDRIEHEACPKKGDCAGCEKTLCLRAVAAARCPTMHGEFVIVAFENNKDGKDHSMLVKGDIVGGRRVLTRVHSSCVTGDVLGSLRCDCGDQLHLAMDMIEKEGRGVLLYMQQEGRGIGLTNKIRAYMLQDGGMDTYDANVSLGFSPDMREYDLAAAMLEKMGIGSVRLMTNNPDKVVALEKHGVKVEERVPLEIAPNEFNRKYLETKRSRFGHALSGKAR